MKHPACIAIASVIAALALSGCSEEAAAPAPSPSSAALPAGLFTQTAPADAKPVTVTRVTSKAGETVSFSGYVGGRAEPFTEGRAVFLVADVENAPPCSDGCETPWDSCCTASEDIVANSATVQVVDTQGAPLKVTLDGQGGLKNGALVTVTGKVREATNSVFIVDATGISIQTQ